MIRPVPEQDFIAYLRTLAPEDWEKRITDDWTVKDVVAHLTGWEKIDPQMIRDTWRTKKRPWFYETEDFNEFNRRSVEFYRSFSPQALIAEWEKWQEAVRIEIERIGEDRLRAEPRLFSWLFNEKEKDDGHHNHHLRQIRAVIGK